MRLRSLVLFLLCSTAECPENMMQPQRHLQVLFFKRRHTINQFRRVVFRRTTTHFTISTSAHRIIQLVKIISKPSKAPLSITLFPSSIPSPHMYNVPFTPPCPQGVIRIGPRQHKRRNNLITLCQLRLAFRLHYFCSLSLEGHFF